VVKGVNKLIVEVSNPDSEFFERAIFFVKPQMKDTPQKELNKSVNTIIFEQNRHRNRKRGLGVSGGIFFAGAAGFGAAVTAILIKLVS